jgi:hypothetical protein
MNPTPRRNVGFDSRELAFVNGLMNLVLRLEPCPQVGSEGESWGGWLLQSRSYHLLGLGRCFWQSLEPYQRAREVRPVRGQEVRGRGALRWRFGLEEPQHSARRRSGARQTLFGRLNNSKESNSSGTSDSGRCVQGAISPKSCF